MAKVLKKFKPLYITIGILAGLIAICLIRRSLISEKTSYSDAITDQRVFDYGELLTDEEEEKLQKLIDKVHKLLGSLLSSFLISDTVFIYVPSFKIFKNYLELSLHFLKFSSGISVRICIRM